MGLLPRISIRKRKWTGFAHQPCLSSQLYKPRFPQELAWISSGLKSEAKPVLPVVKLFSVLCSNAAKSAYKRPSTRGRGILKRIEEWNFTAFHRLHAFSIEPDIAVSHSTPSHCPHGLRVITTIRSSFVHGRSRIFATFLRWMRHSISRARVLTSRPQKLARIHGILSCERNRNSVGTKLVTFDTGLFLESFIRFRSNILFDE